MANPETTERDSTAETSAQASDMSGKDSGTAGKGSDASKGSTLEDVVTVATAGKHAQNSESAAAPAPEAKPAAKPEPAKPAKAPPPPPRGGMSVLLGGVVAAAIGATATLVVLPKLPPDLRDAVMPNGGAGSAVEKAVADQAAKLDAIEKAMSQSQVAGPEVAALQTALGELKAKVDALAAAPAPTVVDNSAEVEALKTALAALTEKFEKAPAFASQQQLEAATAEAKAKIAAAEADTAKMRAESEAAAKRTIAQATVARVAAAFDGGTPIDTQLAEAEAAGIAIPEALRGDLPSIAAVKAAFPEAARKALATARKDTAGESLQGKLGSFLLAQTGARSLSAKEGTGPDAVLSRAQSAVDEGRFDAALTEIAALPAAAQADLQDWKAMVEKRSAAQAAIAEMAQSVK